ncbi:MAG: hypothetical protein CM15mP65_16240 [Crocinitomicaceae bacterium]|nr:MAG: hypothetical protein CM15mP65_16240 [Crocinitomicaceae bacterium]
MGARKRNSSEKLKEVKKSMAIAKLNNCPTSPRKMRLVADLVRGEDVYNALNILKFSPKHASRNLEKLLLSAINNWEQKTKVKMQQRQIWWLKAFMLTVLECLKEYKLLRKVEHTELERDLIMLH